SAVSSGHNNAGAAGDKTAVANPVSGEYKTDGVNFVPAGDKTAVANPVSGEYKTDGVNFVPARDKTGSAQIAVSGGHKNAAAGGDESAVSTGHKNAAAAGDKTAVANSVSGGYKTDGVNLVPAGDKTGSAQISVSGGHRNVAAAADYNASPASAARMDAFAGTAWTVFAATGQDGMVFFAAGRGAFTVAGCFERFISGIRCAGCGYVVMNSFFVCRDGFIFSRLVISFLPLKEPLRARGIFLCWRFYEC
ncbi:MAG: hypothetical protein ACFN9G_11545, partial [Cardiobacterium sp.]